MITHACKAGGWRCGRYQNEARWSGQNTCHCTQCSELFVSYRAADMHATLDERGDRVCHDPATRKRKNGMPMFEKVPKPMWDPPYAWREFRPDLPERPEARERRNLRRAAAVPGTPGTPGLAVPTEIDAVPSEEAS